MNRANKQSERGHAIIELAFVIPVLLAFAFAGIEFSRSLNELQVATALSRELASILYRECAAEPTTPPASRFDPEVCFENEIQTFAAQVGPIAPGAHFIGTLFSSTGTMTFRMGPQVTDEGAINPNYPTKFDPTHADSFAASGSDLERAVDEVQTIVAAEVYLEYEPWLGLTNYFSYNAEKMYAATII